MITIDFGARAMGPPKRLHISGAKLVCPLYACTLYELRTISQVHDVAPPCVSITFFLLNFRTVVLCTSVLSIRDNRQFNGRYQHHISLIPNGHAQAPSMLPMEWI